MASKHILRIPRSDSEGDFILANATSTGPSPLDMKLLATEGESPYIINIKQNRISKYRTKNSPLRVDQWESILLSTLLQQRNWSGTAGAEALEKLEVIATINGDQLVIIFRKNISGITQRLGEISLTKDESQEIDTISWAATAVTRGTDLETEVQDLTVKYDEQAKTMQKLNQQLEDLIEVKKLHENTLLEKFCELLNAKKLKIRDQQRLLVGAKVDPQKGILPTVQIRNTRTNSKSRAPTSSRPRKRKTPTISNPPASASPSSSDNEDGSRKSHKQESPQEEERPAQATPDHSDLDATEDENSDDEDLDSIPASTSQFGKAKALGSVSTTEDRSGHRPSSPPPAPPPRRELPFPKQSVADKETVREQVAVKADPEPSQPVQEADGDETSDDEL